MLACLSTNPILERVSSCDWNLSSGGALSPWLAMLLTIEFIRVRKDSIPAAWAGVDEGVAVVVVAVVVVVVPEALDDSAAGEGDPAAPAELRAELTAGIPIAV